jgi:hypothetical protein
MKRLWEVPQSFFLSKRGLKWAFWETYFPFYYPRFCIFPLKKVIVNDKTKGTDQNWLVPFKILIDSILNLHLNIHPSDELLLSREIEGLSPYFTQRP